MLISEIPEEYIVEYGRPPGEVKKFISFQGLLSVAHKIGFESLVISLEQIPTNENGYLAIARAELRAGKKLYIDYGDATPKNVGPKIAPHIIRMASTRAKARVFRDFCNIGLACIDEIDMEPDGKDGKPEESKIEPPGGGLPTYMTTEQAELFSEISTSLVGKSIPELGVGKFMTIGEIKRKIAEAYKIGGKTTEKEAEAALTDMIQKYKP